jgi:hypothetical protein
MGLFFSFKNPIFPIANPKKCGKSTKFSIPKNRIKVNHNKLKIGGLWRDLCFVKKKKHFQ